MKRKNYLLFAGCLLLVLSIASISLAKSSQQEKAKSSQHEKAKFSQHEKAKHYPKGKIPDHSMPAMKFALRQCNDDLAQCNDDLAQCDADLAESQAHPQFSVLNPRGDRPDIVAVSPSPRLSSLTGMTIAVVANYNPTMAPLATAFATAGNTVIFVSDLPVAQGQSPRPITLPGVTNMYLADFENDPTQADAIIVGNGF